MKFHETMRASMRPDMYNGVSCNEFVPDWSGSADGDKDGDGTIGPVIELAAHTFPPGTRVTIEVPCCPTCGEPADVGNDALPGPQPCGCGFDWPAWMRDEYC